MQSKQKRNSQAYQDGFRDGINTCITIIQAANRHHRAIAESALKVIQIRRDKDVSRT